MFQRLELAEQLLAAENVEPLVDADDLHCEDVLKTFYRCNSGARFTKYLTTILRLSLRSTYDGRLIYKTSHEGRKAFLRYDSLAKL